MDTHPSYGAPSSSSFTTYQGDLLDYSLLANKEYNFVMSSTYDPLGINNLSVGSSEQYYRFIYQTDLEIDYEEVYPQPVPETLVILNPVLQQAQPTALGIRFTVATRPVHPAHIIEIFLDSHNLIRDMYSFTSTPLECAEGIRGVLTNAEDLVCDVKQYPINKKPLVVRVYPTKTVPINSPV